MQGAAEIVRRLEGPRLELDRLGQQSNGFGGIALGELDHAGEVMRVEMSGIPGNDHRAGLRSLVEATVTVGLHRLP